MSLESSALIVAWIVIVLLSLAVAGIIRQVRYLSAQPGRALTMAQATPLVGRPAPVADGGPEIEPGKPNVLLFASGDCQVCTDRFADLDAVAVNRPGVVFSLVVAGEAKSFRSESGKIRVFANAGSYLARFEVPVTPFGVVVGSDGLISAATPLGSKAAVQDLITAAEAGMEIAV